MGFGVVVFADGAISGGATGVEIAEGGKAEAVGAGAGFEEVLHVELGLAVGVDGFLGEVFRDGEGGGLAVGGAGGGEDELADTRCLHGAQ